MIEKIDYLTLIDPLCLETIKYLREKMKIDTKFCCQGCHQGEPKPEPFPSPSGHSIRGYISAVYTDESFNLFLQVYEFLKERWPMNSKPARKPKFEVDKERNKVTFYLPLRRWKDESELRKVWEGILETIKNYNTQTLEKDE